MNKYYKVILYLKKLLTFCSLKISTLLEYPPSIYTIENIKKRIQNSINRIFSGLTEKRLGIASREGEDPLIILDI
jgi:hypothetical protein